MKWLTGWFLQNPVAANLLMALIVISGWLSYQSIRIEAFPQMEPTSLSIVVEYPGGTAKQIDESITQRVEDAISDISGIKQIISESSAGFSTVRVVKKSGQELNRLLDNVRNRVDSITEFPAQALRPKVTRDDFDNLASFVVVSGDRSDHELQSVARQIEISLKAHPDISKVSNMGARTPVIEIVPDVLQLQNYGLSLEALSGIVEQASFESKTGEIKSDRGRMILRGDGYADNVRALNELIVISDSAGTVKLGDIARVSRGYESTGSIVRNNQKTAIALMISTSKKDNLIRVSDAVESVLADEGKALPQDIKLDVIADYAPYIEEQITRLGTNAWLGLLIIVLLLGLFLELKLAFWVAAGIPIAMFGTLSVMGIYDYSLNDITLFGFILVLGILVDDAVVVGESIHEAGKTHKDSIKASFVGVEAVSVATVFGVLTTIAAFSPMLWLDNELAKLLASFSAVVIMALVFSLIESKLILPVHLASSNSKTFRISFVEKLQEKAKAFLNWLNYSIYKPALTSMLDQRAATAIIFVTFFVLAYGLWSVGAIKSSIFPDIPSRYISAKVTLVDGAPIPLQEKTLYQLERSAFALSKNLQDKYALESDPIENLLIWSDGYGELEATIELNSDGLSKLPSNKMLDEWRALNGEIEGAYSKEFGSAEQPAGGTSFVVSAKDRGLAIEAANEIAELLERYPSANDVYHDGRSGQRQVKIKLNDYGRQLGLSQYRIAQLAGGAFGEREIYKLLQQGKETKVIIKYGEQQKISPAMLLNTPIILENGRSVALADVANLEFSEEPEVVYRRNRDQVINIYWKQNRALKSPEALLNEIQPKLNEIEDRYAGVKIKPAGEFEELEDVSAGFKSALILTMVLIYVLLAIPLKSYWQPFIIMSVIPFGFVGAILGHGIMGLPVSILSMFGMMAMAGVVINDSLILLTRFNEYFRAGMPLRDALIKTGTGRFRAIFLTTITTVCGLIPLLSETSEQAQYLKPAAVSLVFGELFATTVTLLLIPLILSVAYKRKDDVTTKSEVVPVQ